MLSSLVSAVSSSAVSLCHGAIRNGSCLMTSIQSAQATVNLVRDLTQSRRAPATSRSLVG